MNEERRSTRDSRHPHGIAHDASPGATDPMDRFLMQMIHMWKMVHNLLMGFVVAG